MKHYTNYFTKYFTLDSNELYLTKIFVVMQMIISFYDSPFLLAQELYNSCPYINQEIDYIIILKALEKLLGWI